MDLINEQNIIRFQIGEQSGKIAGFIEDRAGSSSDIYPKLICKNVC